MLVSRFPRLPILPSGSVICYGDFDGVHAAHRAVLREPLERHVTVVAIHHPKHIRRGRLNRLSGVVRGLQHAGVEIVIVASPHLTESSILEALRENYGEIEVIPVNAMRSTTTTIGEAIASGHIIEAQRLLGTHPEIEGHITQGEQRGRTIGFPTANIYLGPQVSPQHGVYAVRGLVEGHPDWIDGIANMGVRPTFGGKPPVLEVHFFNFAQDIYGKRVLVRLIDMVRAEKKFDGIDALKAQIARDCDMARERLADAGPL